MMNGNKTTHGYGVVNMWDGEGIVVTIEGRILSSDSPILLSQTVFIFIINVYYLL